MIDQDVFEKLLSIALGLLEFNRQDKCYQWGENLYQIYKYLEERLNVTNETDETTVLNRSENQENQDKEINEHQEEDHQVKIIKKFYFHGTDTLTIHNRKEAP